MRLLDLVTDFTGERDSVEFPFGLPHERPYPGVTSVEGPGETWLCLFCGHMPDNSTTESGYDRTLFATLQETTKQNAHPFPRLDTLPVAETRFLVLDLGVKTMDVFTKSHQGVRLLPNVLVIYPHLTKLLLGGFGFGL